MAGIAENDPAPILLAAQGWRDRCLLGDGSVFSKENVWSAQNLSEFATRFIDHPIQGGEKDFYMKFQEQLSGAPAAVCKLSAEMLWVYFLFPTKVSSDTKREGILKTWAWSGENLSPSDPNLQAPLEHGTGFPWGMWLLKATACLVPTRRTSQNKGT
jgi:5-methylcytosine-specific restriction protein B